MTTYNDDLVFKLGYKVGKTYTLIKDQLYYKGINI